MGIELMPRFCIYLNIIVKMTSNFTLVTIANLPYPSNLYIDQFWG